MDTVCGINCQWDINLKCICCCLCVVVSSRAVLILALTVQLFSILMLCLTFADEMIHFAPLSSGLPILIDKLHQAVFEYDVLGLQTVSMIF